MYNYQPSKRIRIHVKGVFKYIKIGFKSSLFLSFGKLLLILEVKDFFPAAVRIVSSD